jgi:dihydroorotate dehydrogenase
LIPLATGEQVTGRLSGVGLFPQSLLVVRDSAQAGIPIIGAGGVGSKKNADAMLSVGALAVQMDASLWRGDVTL